MTDTATVVATPIYFDVIVTDAQGQPVAGAVVLLNSTALSGSMRYTDGGGFANFYSGPPLAASETIDVMVLAAGYVPWTTGVNMVQFQSDPIKLNVSLASFKKPFTPAPRVWKANLCGIRVPGLPPVAGGAADPTLFLSWFYDRYDAPTRAVIQQAWAAHGLTHWLLSWPDSRAAGATPASFLATCEELIAASVFPCVMLCSKDYDPSDAPNLLAAIQPVLPLLIGRVPMICLGWELNLWLSPDVVATLRDTLAPQILAKEPRTLVYVHFGPGVFAWQENGQPTSAFWNVSVGKLTGVLHQRDQSEDQGDMGQYQARITDCLERFNGADGFVTDSGFGHPFDFVAMEITATQQFHGQMTEAEGDAWAAAALATPKSGNVGVMGVGN